MDAELSHILNELGEDRMEYFGSVAPPVIQTSNFAFSTFDEFRRALANESAHYIYSRAVNPTVDILAKKLAALDGAQKSLVVNSGAGAIYLAVLANVQAGDHIVSVRNPYSWAQKLFDIVLPKFGITTTYIDARAIEHFENALKPNTSLFYLETPVGWTFELQDLASVAALAKSKGIFTVCDNSYCTPLYQKPLELGIDLVLQSATKYLNGHSDVIAGVLSGSREVIDRIFHSEYMNMGIGTTPFNAWLILRGLRTLPVRLEKSTANALAVIAFLEQRPEVETVYYPFHEHSPQYSLARRQMKGAGGLFSFDLKADSIHGVKAFCQGLQHILLAVSWGGYESLIMPAAVSMADEVFDAGNPHHRRIRMYAGVEDSYYLIEDLKRGFAAMR